MAEIDARSARRNRTVAGDELPPVRIDSFLWRQGWMDLTRWRKRSMDLLPPSMPRLKSRAASLPYLQTMARMSGPCDSRPTLQLSGATASTPPIAGDASQALREGVWKRYRGRRPETAHLTKVPAIS
jgi:hypothetical protein